MAIKAVFLMLWLAAVAYYILSAYCLRGFFGRTGAGGDKKGAGEEPWPALTVMKPIRGADGNTYENLASFIRQDYPKFQVVFGIADKEDPAREVVEKLIADNPGRDLALVITGTQGCANYKVGNLMAMYAKARYDILVVADSDMRVGPDYLKEIAKGFGEPSVGLVTCLYRGAYPESIGAALEALTINIDFLPSVVVAERLEGLSFALGATMAVRREALEKIGGFASIADYLADDYQLGSRVKKAGYGLALSGYIVDSVQGRESISGYFLHQLRWGRTYRVCRPRGYFFWVLTQGTAFSVLFLVATGFSTAGWALVLTNLAVRYSQALFIEAGHVRGPGVLGWFWLLPLKDLLSFVIWVLSFTGSEITWKGSKFKINNEGRMVRLGKENG